MTESVPNSQKLSLDSILKSYYKVSEDAAVFSKEIVFVYFMCIILYFLSNFLKSKSFLYVLQQWCTGFTLFYPFWSIFYYLVIMTHLRAT